MVSSVAVWLSAEGGTRLVHKIGVQSLEEAREGAGCYIILNASARIDTARESASLPDSDFQSYAQELKRSEVTNLDECGRGRLAHLDLYASVGQVRGR